MALAEVLADLQGTIGEETHESDWLTVTQELIDLFANATGDKQWIHVDEARAKAESPYGSTIAHGKGGGKMPAFIGKLSKRDINDLIAFVRTLKQPDEEGGW